MAKDFSAVFGKISAQEEEDKRLAEEERKKAEEEARKKAAEEAAKKKAEEEARARKEADVIGAQDAERLSQDSGAKTYSAPAQKAAIERSENMAKRTAGDYSSETAVENKRQERQKALNENIKNVYEGMDKQLRQGIYGNAIDNQSAAMAAEWIYSPGAAIAEYATGVGEALRAEDKQYISPAAAARYNIGGNIAERTGADEQREFSFGETVAEKAPEWRKNLGERIIEVYEDNAALEYKKHAEEQRTLANEQTESPIGKVALGLADAINSMAVAGAYSKVTGLSISQYMAFTGGADKTADYIEAGYSPIAALGAGIAWGKVLEEIEGGSSFGHVSGGLVDTAAKKIGDYAVKLAGQFIDGKTIAAVVDMAKGPIVKRLLGGLSEGAEEMAEYGLEYVFDSILGREDVSFDVKEFFYSGLIGTLAGEFFEFSNAHTLPAEIAYHFSEEGRTERAAEIKEYLDSVDPRILESVAEGNLDAVEETMKSIPAEQFEKPESFIENSEERSMLQNAEQQETSQEGLFGPEIYNRILGVEDPKVQAQMDEVSEIGNRLGIDVAFSRDIISDGLHTADGRIYINPDAKNPLRQVLVHELTHEIESSGLYANLSAEILDYAQRVHGVELESMRRKIREDYSIIGQEISTAEDADKEIVAKFAEQYLFRDEASINRLCNTNPNLFQRIRYWISDMLVKFRGTSEEQFLRNAERLYARAWASRGEIQGAGVEQASYDYSKPFEQQVDDWKAGKIPPRDTLVVGATPRIFQDVGFNALPMTINQTHIDYALNGTKGANHFYGADIKKLPQAIENPVAIISSKTQNGTSVVALVNLPVNGLETVVPVYIDGAGRQNNLRIDANALTSIHGRNNTAQLLADAINEEAAGNISVFYFNKKEAQSLLHRAGLQLPGGMMPRDGFNHSIHESGSPVKPKLNDVTESLQFKRWFGDWQNHPENASKVVDDDGKPLIVYHGTDAEFTVFDRTKSRANMDIQGNFFSPWKDDARGYGQNVGAYYLNIKNPADEATAYKALRRFQGQNEAGAKARDYLISLGYDGVNNNDEEYIAFYPEQIKSATNNVGTFDPQNPDFRHSTGRSYEEMREETKSGKPIEHGEYEGVAGEAEQSARNVLEILRSRPKAQSSTGQVKTQAFESNEPEVSVPQAEKSIRFERRYQRTVEDGVASVFGVSRSDLKGNIRPIIEEIAADLKDGKNISDSRLDALYEAAFDDGIITEEFPQYRDTRKYIRTTPIYVDEKTRHEFGDDYAFRDFARSNFGSIKISSDPRSSHLDSFYTSLSEIEPDFFDAMETDPKTQLESIADFMQQTKKQYYGLSEVYSGKDLAEFESWAKAELRNYLDDFKKGIDIVSRYERDRQIKATNKARSMNAEASFDEAKAAFANSKVFDAKRALEEAQERNLLNETDKIAVKRLLEGTMTEADVRFQNAGNVEGILEVYEAEKAYKEARAPFDRYKAAYKNALLHEAIEATENSDEWNDKKIGAFYSRETAERNILDVTKNGRLGGEKVLEEYFEPVHENEAMKNRWISELNSRVRELELGRMNKWERAYAQMIGENAVYIAEGRITKHNQFEHDILNQKIGNILREHGNKIDKAKCEKAAAGLIEIYDDIHRQWNDERIRRGQEPVGYIEGYFPHFQEAKPETVLQKIFAALGFDIGSSKLPTDIAGRTADRKPNSKYNPHANRRKGDITEYDIFKGFDSYIRAVGDNIFHTEDIQKLRTLSDTIRTKYSSAEIEKRIEEIRNRNDISEIDKEILIDDIFKNIGNQYHLSNFVVWLDEYTNILAGKKNRGDREAEYQMGREVYDISKALEGRIAANMIGYNASTPIMNLVPLFQATADLSPADIISSLAQTGIAALKGDSYISDNSDFIINRLGVDSVYKQNYSLFTAENMKDAVAKIQDAGAFTMEFVDRIVSDTLVRARVTQNMRDRGMSTEEAFSEADQWAAGLIADRSLGALPTVFNVKNPIAKAFTMFQIEANNQYSYITKDAGSYKWDKKGAVDTITGQLAFWTAMAICNGLAKELLGRDNVVPDPVGITAEMVAKLQKGEQVGDVMLDTATSIVEQIPFIGGIMGGGRVPISTALPDMEQIAKLFNEEVSDEKKGQIFLESLAKPLSYILAPSGAGQIWKTWQGADQIIRGGAYGTEADGTEYLKFLQGKELDDLYKTILFGRYASDAGQEYIDSGFSTSLSVKQTEQMKMAEYFGVSNEEFYEAMMELRNYGTKAAKQEALFNMDISEEAKNAVDGILWGETTYKDEKPQSTRNYSSAEAFYESGLELGDWRLHEMGYSPEEIDVINSALGESKTKADDIENLAAALDITEAEAFEVYQRRNGDWIEDESDLSEKEATRASGAANFYGMSTEDYIAVLNADTFGGSTKAEKIESLMTVNGWDYETAAENYNRVFLYDYSREDISGEQAERLDTAQSWYGVDDYGYFVARNAIKTAEGETDKYGNTVSGSKKAAAIKAIAKELGIDESEAAVYYLAANGDLVLSVSDLSSAKQADLEEAKKYGWTEMQFINAVNVVKLAGATKKADIIEALVAAGATYEMAYGYYNLTQNLNYYKR